MVSARSIRKTLATLSKRSVESLTVGVLGVLFVALYSAGIDWGLPTLERRAYYGGQDGEYVKPQEEKLYNTSPYESFHPDEGAIFNALSNMNPAKGDFNPKFFNYPTLLIYQVGLLLYLSDKIGLLNLSNDKKYYIDHPEQMAKMYIVGRLLVLALSFGTIVVLYFISCEIFGLRYGWIAPLLLLINPLWFRDSHFMMVNVAATFWATLAVYATIKYILNPINRYQLFIASLLIGFSASTKYPAIVFVGLLVYALHRVTEFKLKNLILVSIIVVAGFILGTPYSILASDSFLHGFIFEAESKTGLPGSSLLLSTFIFALGIGGLIAASWGSVVLLLRWKQRNAVVVVALIALVLSMVQRLISDANYIRYFVLSLPWFAVLMTIPILPWDRRTNDTHRRIGNIGKLKYGIYIGLIGIMGSYTVSLAIAIEEPDPRMETARWIEANLPHGTRIGIEGYLYYDMPIINTAKYVLVDVDKNGCDSVDVVVSNGTHGMSEVLFRSSNLPSSFWTLNALSPDDWEYTYLSIAVGYCDE